MNDKRPTTEEYIAQLDSISPVDYMIDTLATQILDGIVAKWPPKQHPKPRKVYSVEEVVAIVTERIEQRQAPYRQWFDYVGGW